MDVFRAEMLKLPICISTVTSKILAFSIDLGHKLCKICDAVCRTVILAE